MKRNSFYILGIMISSLVLIFADQALACDGGFQHPCVAEGHFSIKGIDKYAKKEFSSNNIEIISYNFNYYPLEDKNQSKEQNSFFIYSSFSEHYPYIVKAVAEKKEFDQVKVNIKSGEVVMEYLLKNVTIKDLQFSSSLTNQPSVYLNLNLRYDSMEINLKRKDKSWNALIKH